MAGRSRSRRVASVALIVLGAALGALSGVLFYVHHELAGADAFSDRLVSSLDDRAVRATITAEIVAALAERAPPGTAALRPRVERAVADVVAGDRFRRAGAASARAVHRELTGEAALTLELGRAAPLIEESLRRVSPQLAAATSIEASLQLARVRSGDGGLEAVRRVLDATRWRWWLLVAAAVAALAGVACAANRFRAFAGLAVAVAVAALLVAGAVSLGGDQVVESFGSGEGERTNDAIDAVWAALFGDLTTVALIVAAAALLVAIPPALAARPRR